jgi:hypothetical protein
MGLIGASILVILLYLMNVETSSTFSVGVGGWIVITSCLNFRAYHVEDVGSLKMKKELQSYTLQQTTVGPVKEDLQTAETQTREE